MRENLPPYVPLDRVRERLPSVFPDGTPQRNYLVRDIAARTVFVALYVGAVEGSGRWFRPNQVTRMSDPQSLRGGNAERAAWVGRSLARSAGDIQGRWYADNTREPIRDETLRNGLVDAGAVVERPGIATTSSLPRYALTASFAALFTCSDAEFDTLAPAWRQAVLSASARIRIALRAAGAGSKQAGVLVHLPNGETRKLEGGASGVIARDVIEVFAVRWLAEPAVVWLSESRRHVVASDAVLAEKLGLPIDASRLLPDLILADLAAEPPLLVFVEVVATAGPIDERRRAALCDLAKVSGLPDESVAFVTAFEARDKTYRSVADQIAWDTAVWFRVEPDHLLVYAGDRWRATGRRTLAQLWRRA